MKQLAALLAAASLLAGCSWFGGRAPDYRGAQARATQPLEVPPELTTPTYEERYAIPDAKGRTFSTYNQQAPAAVSASGPAVLPRFDNVRLEREGDHRWLVVEGDPEKIWPVVREFWVESGYPLVREEPELGLLETEWYEDRAKIPDDFVRRTIGRVMPNMWSTSRRDKFRTRLERGAKAGTTEIFISNRAVEEQFVSQAEDSTKWVPIPPDAALEAEMLSRLQLKLGGGDTRVADAAPAAVKPEAAGTGAAPAAESRNASLQNGGAGPLVVNDSFDRAWRRVGLALDRGGFTVEDRDRSKGLFFVRYIDPEADAASGGRKEGFLDKLAFWRSSSSSSSSTAARASQPQYRIHVTDAGGGRSQVQVQNAEGAVDTSPTSRKILALLFDQLK